MRIVGIIAEYNPFHLGHKAQIEALRAMGYDAVVAVMSSNVVQRGDFAVCHKEIRAQIALEHGADLVLELPGLYACATAQRFATAGVTILNSLGCVDALAFGSECGDLQLLERAASLCEDADVNSSIKELMGQGITFAAARQQAVAQCDYKAAELLANPNDILGIEYLRACKALGSKMTPVCIKRTGAAHDSNAPSAYSASAVRRQWLADGTLPNDLPGKACLSQRKPVTLSQLDQGAMTLLSALGAPQISNAPDVAEGLENRIYTAIRASHSVSEICDLAKSKRYTHARLRRTLLHLLCGITKADAKITPPYIRVLGMNDRGCAVLRAAKAQAKLPLVQRTGEMQSLSPEAKRVFALECRITDLYNLACGKPLGEEFHYQQIKL